MDAENSGNIDYRDAINVDWILKNGLKVVLPSNTTFKIKMVKFLYEQVTSEKEGDRIQTVLNICYNLSRAGFYKYKKYNFNWANPAINKKARKEHLKNKRMGTIPFEVILIDAITGKTLYNLILNINKLETYDEYIKQNPNQKIKPEEVIDLREKMEDEPLEVEVIFNQDQRQEQSRKICVMFATGLIGIEVACEKNGTTYRQFLEWAVSDPVINQYYKEAIEYHRFNNNSRNEERLDSIISTLLLKGKHETVVTVKRLKRSPKYPAGILVTEESRHFERDFTQSELAVMKSILNRQLLPEMQDADEISNMSTEELESELQKQGYKKFEENNDTN